MVLKLRSALAAALGDSISVTHQGNPFTVPITTSGKGDETAYPAVWIGAMKGNMSPSDVGGGAVMEDANILLEIGALDDEDIDGAIMLEDIHEALETPLRAVEASLGDSLFSLVVEYDESAETDSGGFTVYSRVLVLRAENLQTY